MAYGLDFQEIYYADHNRVDIGVLETYEIDIDLADEKDFSITSPDPVIPIGGFWYIQNTEYGGIVDAFYTDSDEESIQYEGRSFRGILDSHIVDVDGKQRVMPDRYRADVDASGAIDDDSEMLKATITDCFNELVVDFEGLFVVDAPDTNEDVDTRVPEYVIPAGTTVYDAMVGLARSIDFTFVLEYRSDKRIHIVPILIQDYTDYLKGSKYEGIGFQTDITTKVTNHLISTAYDEDTGELYRIHFFADENGGIQPYATVDAPVKDAQYILDKRNQVLFGIDEITEYKEAGVSVAENYELLTKPPADWNMNFGDYFHHDFNDDGDESWNLYEADGHEVYTAVTSEPADWSTNYSSYYIRSTDEQTGEYVYTSVSGVTIVDLSSVVKVNSEKKPKDWTSNYNEYYYKFQTGTGIEYRQYQGVTKPNYVRMTKKPSDWNDNFSSYYRKVYEKKVGGKTQLIDTVKHKDAKYVPCRADDDRKNGVVPSFTKRAHYRNDSYTKAPTYQSNNCYRVRKIEVAPTFDPVNNRYFSMTMEYHAPKFVVGNVYRMVFDHYSDMVQDAIEFFADEKRKSKQTMELEDFVVNIGDIIGGTDEYTSTSVVGNVTNIEARIKNGLIDVSYSVTVDDYTTEISEKRKREEGE